MLENLSTRKHYFLFLHDDLQDHKNKIIFTINNIITMAFL